MTPIHILGIVGSRHYGMNAEECRQVQSSVILSGLFERGVTKVAVSGGAPRVDSAADWWLRDSGGIEFRMHSIATEQEQGSQTLTECAHARNQKIVDDIDGLVALPCRHSKGTIDTIKRAILKSIPVVVIPVNCSR